MATAKTDTGVSWAVAFDFGCEPNSLSPLLSGGNILWTMHDENRNLDNSCTILFGSPFIDKDRYFVWLLVVELLALWEQYGLGSQTTSVLLLFYEYVAEGWVQYDNDFSFGTTRAPPEQNHTSSTEIISWQEHFCVCP